MAYSMGQIIKSFCVCACVCPSLDTLTVAFLRLFSPNWTQTCKLPKVRTSSLWGGHCRPTPFPISPQKKHFWPRGPENPCKNEKRNICLKCSRITEITASYRKSGSGNTIVTSDFWPEVMDLWTRLWGRYHVPQNVFLVGDKSVLYLLKCIAFRLLPRCLRERWLTMPHWMMMDEVCAMFVHCTSVRTKAVSHFVYIACLSLRGNL